MKSTDSRSDAEPSIGVSDVFGLSTSSSASFSEQSKESKGSQGRSVASRRGSGSQPLVINEDEELKDAAGNISFGLFSTKDGSQSQMESFFSPTSSRRSSKESESSLRSSTKEDAIDMFKDDAFDTEHFVGSQAFSEPSVMQDQFSAPEAEESVSGSQAKSVSSNFRSESKGGGLGEESFPSSSPKSQSSGIAEFPEDSFADGFFSASQPKGYDENAMESPNSAKSGGSLEKPRKSDDNRVIGESVQSLQSSRAESKTSSKQLGGRFGDEESSSSKESVDVAPAPDDRDVGPQNPLHYEKSITLGEVFGASKLEGFGADPDPNKSSSSKSSRSDSTHGEGSYSGSEHSSRRSGYSSRKSTSLESAHGRTESFQTEQGSQSHGRSGNSRSQSSHKSDFSRSSPERSAFSGSRSYSTRSGSYGSSHPSQSSRSGDDRTPQSGIGSQSNRSQSYESSQTRLSVNEENSRGQSRSSSKSGSDQSSRANQESEISIMHNESRSSEPAGLSQSSHPSQSSGSAFGPDSRRSDDRRVRRGSHTSEASSRSRSSRSSRTPSRQTRHSSFRMTSERSQSTLVASFTSSFGAPGGVDDERRVPELARESPESFVNEDLEEGRESPSSFEASFSSRSYESRQQDRTKESIGSRPDIEVQVSRATMTEYSEQSFRQSSGESSKSSSRNEKSARNDSIASDNEQELLDAVALAPSVHSSGNFQPTAESEIPLPVYGSPGEVGLEAGIGISPGDSRSLSILRGLAVPLQNHQEHVYASVRNEGFLNAVEAAYMILLESRPRIRYMFSLAEWCHIHILMLYSRVFDCELKAANIEPPKDFRIQLPDDLQVLEPLAVALASIGIVEDASMGVIYVPVAKKPMYKKAQQSGPPEPSYQAPDPEDVTEFLEWTQYDWNSSWIKVEQARESRKVMAAADGIQLPEKTFPTNHAKLLEWEQLALEKWLGWDDNLWFSYDQTVGMLRRKFCFVDFPNQNPKGTYAWLLPRQVIGSESSTITSTEMINIDSVICKIPKPSLPVEVWMIALLFDFCALPFERTNTWYYQTRPVKDLEMVASAFLRSATKPSKPK